MRECLACWGGRVVFKGIDPVPEWNEKNEPITVYYAVWMCDYCGDMTTGINCIKPRTIANKDPRQAKKEAA